MPQIFRRCPLLRHVSEVRNYFLFPPSFILLLYPLYFHHLLRPLQTLSVRFTVDFVIPVSRHSHIASLLHRHRPLNIQSGSTLGISIHFTVDCLLHTQFAGSFALWARIGTSILGSWSFQPALSPSRFVSFTTYKAFTITSFVYPPPLHSQLKLLPISPAYQDEHGRFLL